jgi:tetratricopeptide (TPR) repeat protein
MTNDKSSTNTRSQSDLSEDFKRTYLFFYGFVVIGMLFVLIGQWSRNPLAALLWAFACLASGGFVGFLFGIPKVAQPSGPPAPGSTAPAAGNAGVASSAAGPSPAAGDGYRLLVNTNLTDISDWLTKIIVGLTLIQLQKIPDNLSRASLFIAYSLGGTEQKSFAAGILVFFSVGGFLGGYLFTRLFLTGAFYRADQPNLTALGAEALRNAVISQESGSQQVSSDAEAAAKQMLSKSLDQLSSPQEIGDWAKAQSIAKNYQAAVEGYNKAISLCPTDVKLRLERAIACSGAGLPRNLIKEQLLDAYKWLTPQTSPELKANLYKELTYAYLYVDPPEGFMGAIRYAEEYLNDPANRRVGPVFAKIGINLAAAYGQKYHWYSLHTDPTVELQATRDKALAAIKAAVAADPAVKDQLRMLMDPASPKKNPDENDLEDFFDDPEFRDAVGMPNIPQGPPAGTDQARNQ